MKLDLTIEDLIFEPKPVNLTIGKKKLTLYIKPITGIEQSLCRGAARRVSRDLRRQLEDTDSEYHQLLVVDEIKEYDRQTLETLWISNRITQRALEIQNQSLEDRDKYYIPEPPEGAPAVVIDHYENEVEDNEKRRENGVRHLVKDAKESLEQEASQLSLEALRADAVEALVDHICQNAFEREFAVQMVARGTFNDKDGVEPAFKFVSQVKKLKDETIAQLALEHYGLIEEPEAIKN